MSLYRTLRWGSLLQTLVLDGRQYRNDQACGTEDLGADCAERTDPEPHDARSRAVRLAAAASWPADRCRWSMLANQTVMTPMPFGVAPTTWTSGTGTPRERSQDPPAARPACATRSSSPATSTPPASATSARSPTARRSSAPSSSRRASRRASTRALADLAEQLLNGLDQVQWFDAHHNGYVRCDITPDEWRADFRIVESTASPTSTVSTITSWRIADGTPGATEIT